MMPVRVSPRRTAADIVELLVRYRVERGMTQAQVAATMCVSRPMVSKFESDRRHDPRFETVLRYAAAVGADLAVITRREGNADA